MPRLIHAPRRRPHVVGPAPLLAGVTIAVALPLLACNGIEPKGPCAPELHPGDSIEATIIESYDESSSTHYDTTAFFGPNPVDWLLEGCNAGRDQILGAAVMFDVVKQSKDPSGSMCAMAIMQPHDYGSVAFLDVVRDHIGMSGLGGRMVADALHIKAEVDGCARFWSTYFYVADDPNLLGPVTPDELPPVLLLRGLSETDDDCSYAEGENLCLFVAQLEKL